MRTEQIPKVRTHARYDYDSDDWARGYPSVSTLADHVYKERVPIAFLIAGARSLFAAGTLHPWSSNRAALSSALANKVTMRRPIGPDPTHKEFSSVQSFDDRLSPGRCAPNR